VVLLSVVWSASGNPGGPCGNGVCEAGDFFVEVNGNGNVPKYKFWFGENATNTYSVMFQQMFEAINGSKYGPSNIALPSLTWTWTPFVYNESGSSYNFNITAVNSGHGNKQQFSMLQLRNHLHGANVSKDAYLKFDVLIDNYTWVSTDPTAQLVLVFQMNVNGANASFSLRTKSNAVGNGEVYFQITSMANSWSGADRNHEGETPASLTLQGGNSIWLTYNHFEGNLEHDPSFGYGNPGGGWAWWAIALVVIVVAVAVIVVVGLLGFVLWKRNRSSYRPV
jgi:hypothetical protein